MRSSPSCRTCPTKSFGRARNSSASSWTAGNSLDDLLVPAFATVREAAKRTLGQRHFDVQLIGGMVLHQGDIAEMKTGEGKTLVATLPVYLNALTGKGVHVVTVNDYLAKRDADWMGQVYRFLGLTVGCIDHDMSDEARKIAYACDVTYGTNNELGFDYLRDNMKMNYTEMVQRPHTYAIVDEVDSILIDEARTPLIISGPLEDRADLYQQIDEMMKIVTPEDFELDEKQRQVSFTEAGNEKMERALEAAGLLKGTLYDIDNVTIVHHLTQALKAHKLFQRDKDYIVKGGQVVIIDEFTGRMMPGRRYSEGLHQALEAKEKVEVQPENQTLASITFQNYFRLYKKLAGMTGTAMTEASEFMDIYGLEVIDIPTNLPVSRIDEDDEIYRTQREKLAAIVQSIAEAKRSRPADPRRHDVDREVGAAIRASEGPQVLQGTRQAARRAGRRPQARQGRRASQASDRYGRASDEVRERGEGQGRPDPASGAERPLSRAGSEHRCPGRPARSRDDRDQHGGPRHRHSAGRQRRVSVCATGSPRKPQRERRPTRSAISSQARRACRRRRRQQEKGARSRRPLRARDRAP